MKSEIDELKNKVDCLAEIVEVLRRHGISVRQKPKAPGRKPKPTAPTLPNVTGAAS